MMFDRRIDDMQLTEEWAKKDCHQQDNNSENT